MAKQIVTKTLESGAKVSSIGTVKSVIGVVTATGSDGVVRTLQVGDKVFMNPDFPLPMMPNDRH